MRRIYGVNDEHNGIIIKKFKEDGSKKMMFNHIKRLMRKQEHQDTSVNILNGSVITVSNEQEVGKEIEIFRGKLFCTNGKVIL